MRVKRGGREKRVGREKMREYCGVKGLCMTDFGSIS
jgi:hypothetical protein